MATSITGLIQKSFRQPERPAKPKFQYVDLVFSAGYNPVEKVPQWQADVDGVRYIPWEGVDDISEGVIYSCKRLGWLGKVMAVEVIAKVQPRKATVIQISAPEVPAPKLELVQPQVQEASAPEPEVAEEDGRIWHCVQSAAVSAAKFAEVLKEPELPREPEKVEAAPLAQTPVPPKNKKKKGGKITGDPAQEELKGILGL